MTKMTSVVREKLISNDDELRQLLEVHLGKPKQVEKIFQIIKNHYQDGKLKKKSFNIWAFLGGMFYFLYRKMYYVAGAVFLAITALNVFSTDGAVAGGAISAVCAFIALQSYLEKFFKDAEKSGYGQKNFADVKKAMAKRGGVNNWAIFLYVLFVALTFFARFYGDANSL